MHPLFPPIDPETEGLARAMLDRELMLSATLHDLGGPLTAVQGWAELAEESGGARVDGAIDRIAALLEILADPRAARAHIAPLAGQPVRLRGPIHVLRIAIDDLPHEQICVEMDADSLVLEITGVPREEAATGWTLAQVDGWRAGGGPGLAGARLRIAARVVGAMRLAFRLPDGAGHASVTVRLARS